MCLEDRLKSGAIYLDQFGWINLVGAIRLEQSGGIIPFLPPKRNESAN
jgi:hypothetical protein